MSEDSLQRDVARLTSDALLTIDDKLAEPFHRVQHILQKASDGDESTIELLKRIAAHNTATGEFLDVVVGTIHHLPQSLRYVVAKALAAAGREMRYAAEVFEQFNQPSDGKLFKVDTSLLRVKEARSLVHDAILEIQVWLWMEPTARRNDAEAVAELEKAVSADRVEKAIAAVLGTDANKAAVFTFYRNNPTASLRDAEKATGVAKSTVADMKKKFDHLLGNGRPL